MVKKHFDQKARGHRQKQTNKRQSAGGDVKRPNVLSAYVSFAVFSVILPVFAPQAIEVSDKNTAELDSLFVHQLEEITVTATRSEKRAIHPVMMVNRDNTRAQTAASVADLVYHSPSVGVRVNSRGETVLRIRGSEERQAAIFLDGASLTIPWDGRADLSLLPSHAIGRAQLVKSAAPIEYGTGAILGVLDMISPLYQETPDNNNADSLTAQASMQLGTGGQAAYVAALRYQHEGRVLFATVADHSQQGIPLPNRQQAAIYMPETIEENPLIPNTGREHQSIYTGVRQHFSTGWVGFSVLHIDGNKQIAAAGHLDPDTDTVRYWRYPKWRMTQWIGNANVTLTDSIELRSTAWSQDFSQIIDRFQTKAYAHVTDRQSDQDQTWGGRMILSVSRQNTDFRLIATAQTSRHRQEDYARTQGEGFAAHGMVSLFRQISASVAFETDMTLSNKIKSSWAVGYDFSTTPLTGGRPRQNNLDAVAASGALVYEINKGLSLTVTAGERTRFPTLRELYGTAIGQFILNPDLKPERARLIDVTAQWHLPDGRSSLSVTPWFSDISNSLSQRRIVVDGQPFRQRYNLRGVKGYGMDAALNMQVSDQLMLGAEVTAQTLRAKTQNGIRRAVLQRPSTHAVLSATYRPIAHLSLAIDVDYQSGGQDEDQGGAIKRLPHSTLVNVRASLDLSGSLAFPLNVSLSALNIGDQLRLPQFGLPDAGRRILLNIQTTF